MIAFLFRGCLALGALLGSLTASGAPTRFDALEVGGKVYRNVRVLSQNDFSLSIFHTAGVSQVELADLAPEVRALFDYRPEQAEERRARMEEEKAQRLQQLRAQEVKRRRVEASGALGQGGLSNAFAAFGTPAPLKDEVDLRPLFRARNLFARDQGRSPSCSVHSILSALEYQYAGERGESVKISETHLFESTRKTLGRPLGVEAEEGDDAGFALEEVFQAIRGFGLVFESIGGRELTGGRSEPLGQAKFSAFRVPGRDREVALQNILHVLNAEMPVVVGLAWPDNRLLARTHLLSKQPVSEGAGHAVTLVGYRASEDNSENIRFIFRNSWGPKWGAAGYGFVTYGYLREHLYSAYVVELR